MGFLAALMVFVFPLGMPIVTFVTVLKVSFSKHPLPTRLLRSALLALLLTLLLGPAIERNGAGSFALPWWLLLGGSAEHYVWQYGLFVLSAALVLSLLSAVIRSIRSKG